MLNNKLLNVFAIFALAANSSPLPQDVRDEFYRLADEQREDWVVRGKGDCEWALNYMLHLNPELLDDVTGIDPQAIAITDLCVTNTSSFIDDKNHVQYKGFEIWYQLQSSEQSGENVYVNLFYSGTLNKYFAAFLCSSNSENFDFTCDS